MEQGAVYTGGHREICSLKNSKTYDSVAAAMRCQKLKIQRVAICPFF